MKKTEKIRESSQDVTKPIVLLDVDGVVNWWSGYPHVPEPEGVERFGSLWVPRETSGVIAELHEIAEIWWCTAWRNMANDQVSPVLGLPKLRVVNDRPPHGRGADWKADVVTRLYFDGEFGERRIIWIEDFVASWRNPGMASLLDDRITLVDTSAHGYLRRDMLEGWLLEKMETVDG